MIKNSKYRNIELILILISSMFFLLYGFTPYFANEMQIYDIKNTQINLIFSLECIPILFLIYFLCIKNLKYINNFFTIRISNNKIYSFFLISLLVFYLYPWHDDRESVGASIAAAFRAIWLLIVVSNCNKNRLQILYLMILTTVLMIVDQSRTYFGLALIALGLSLSFWLIPFVLSIISLVAAWRMGEYSNLLDGIIYGIIGEGYNGAKGALQVIQIRDNNIDYTYHIFSLIFQPLITPFEILIKKFNFQDYYNITDISSLVELYTGEIYNPMGGFYIASEFIYYGNFGLFLIFCYLFLAYFICKKFFDTSSFPFGSLLFIISIKAAPFIFWKFILYLYIIKNLINFTERYSKYYFEKLN